MLKDIPLQLVLRFPQYFLQCFGVEREKVAVWEEESYLLEQTP